MRRKFSTLRIVVIHLLLGAVIGVILLHPIAMGVTWSELRSTSVITNGLWDFMLSRFEMVFTARVLPMSLGYALVGGIIGLLFALQYLALTKQALAVISLSHRLTDDLPSLIKGGENEQIEFKASVRWDFQKNSANRSLEMVIAKTVAGFMNHYGGSLVVGVDDEGAIIGLKNDYLTLKHKNRDGFERCVMDIVNKKLGGHKCTLIHCLFHEIEGLDVCRILIDSSSEPVFMNDGQTSKYYVRSGNATRELDTREALAHISQK